MAPAWAEPAHRSEDSESGVATRELSTKLEPNLLRGVPLHVALTGWGRHWKNSESGMFTLERPGPQEAERAQRYSYELSCPTASLDAFLSHDWASNARLKVLSLVIIYNSRAAFLACLAVSILVGVLRAAGLLPAEIWMATFGHLSFFLVLALWQRIRMLFCRPQLVFLDKLCISQQDEQLKQAGILGIAGFLMASRKLIVLWSPRTFLRVWCGFEIGTFLRDRQSRIQIMPLKTGALLLLGSLCWHLLSLCFHVFSKSEDSLLDFKVNFNVLALVSALMILVFALVLPLVYAIGIELMRELAGLPQQLAQFRMQDATCFCCSNGHAHPQTGDPIPCDRQLVFKLLHKWYGRDEDGAELMDEDALESFNAMVRKQLAPRVVSGLGASTLPLPYTVYMVGSCCLPYLSLYIPLWLEEGRSGFGFELFAKSIRLLLDWAIVGVASVFFTRLSLLLWRVGLSLQRCEAWGKGAVVAVLVLSGLALLLLLWIPFELSMFATSETSLLPLLPFLGALVATFGVFSLGGLGRLGLQEMEVEAGRCCPPGDIVERQDSEGSTFQI